VTESDTANTSPRFFPAEDPAKGRLSVAIETSSRTGSIAIGTGAQCLREHTFSGPMQHATELLPALQLLVKEMGASPSDIGEVMVSIGPGSFTGVRIAVMVARTLAQVLGCRLIGVPTTQALALNAPQTDDAPIGIVLDARRGMIFAAAYQWAVVWAQERTDRRPVLELKTLQEPVLADPADILQHWPRNIQLLGEGIAYHKQAVDAAGLASQVLGPETAVPRAAALYQCGRWRAERGEFTPREELLPLYLRKPEAQELWEARHGIGGGQR
jgi:tRNA threonylcarbamoyladenosine biosynthesis protein TsaB